METVLHWQGPTPMDPGAPEPAIVRDGNVAWVVYLAKDPNFPGWDDPSTIDYLEKCPGEPFGVLRFDGVLDIRLGPPSEDRLHKHPLYRRGLKVYGFHRVHPPVDGVARWIVTFHDETLDVRALAARAFPLCFAKDRAEAIDLARRSVEAISPEGAA